MKKKEPIFLIFLILLAVLFLVAGYSLVKVLYQDDWENQMGTYILQAIYLVLHFVFIGIIFYLNFRAYMLGPQLLHGLTLYQNNKINKKSAIFAGIFGGIFLFIAIYSLLIILKIDVPFASTLGEGLSYDVFNGSLMLLLIALEIFIYPFIYQEKNLTL